MCGTYIEICTSSHLDLGLTSAHTRLQQRDEEESLAIPVVKLGLPERRYRLHFHPLYDSYPLSFSTIECLGHKKKKKIQVLKSLIADVETKE